MKQALLSVSDKTGLIPFAECLKKFGIHLLSTGGSAKCLQEKGIPVQEVSDYTHFPEILDGRVKTLHPKIHAGILSRKGKDEKTLETHAIPPIDLVIVNLYPFLKTIEEKNPTLEEAIEQIDIGGTALLRAAAKNYKRVTVVCDPNDYETVLNEIEQFGDTQLKTRFKLAQKAFGHTAFYDAIIAGYLYDAGENLGFPKEFTLPLELSETLRYGENHHQPAALYAHALYSKNSLAKASPLQGKALSFNNLADANAAMQCVHEFDTPTCVIVKHANPCGVSSQPTPLQAYLKAYEADPVSAFGGIIAFNTPVDKDLIDAILEKQFCEVIIAPRFSEEARKKLAQKPHLRVIEHTPTFAHGFDYQSIEGGLLVQTSDTEKLDLDALKVVTQKKPSADEWNDLLFAWKVVKWVKSNAIVYAKASTTLGIGAGQMSRVFSATIASLKANAAGLAIKGSVMASDAFFPFKDSVELAAEQGISAIIQPGGSIRDAEVIAAADALGIAMVLTGIRHFYH